MKYTLSISDQKLLKVKAAEESQNKHRNKKSENFKNTTQTEVKTALDDVASNS